MKKNVTQCMMIFFVFMLFIQATESFSAPDTSAMVHGYLNGTVAIEQMQSLPLQKHDISKALQASIGKNKENVSSYSGGAIRVLPTSARLLVIIAVEAPPDQVDALVTAAIAAAPTMVAEIVIAAVTAAPDQAAAIVTAAIAAAPEAVLVIVKAALAAAPGAEEAIMRAAIAAAPAQAAAIRHLNLLAPGSTISVAEGVPHEREKPSRTKP